MHVIKRKADQAWLTANALASLNKRKRYGNVVVVNQTIIRFGELTTDK